MWYIVYTKKLADPKLALQLKERGLDFFVPVQSVEKCNSDHTKMEVKEVYPLGRLIFIQTEGNILGLIKEIDGLLGIYKDRATNKCATVKDVDMNAFRLFLSSNNDRVLFLKDPFSHFANKQRVRVRGGDFAGQEGHIVRILKSRKLVIELGPFAVAITGIDPSLLEPIDDK